MQSISGLQIERQNVTEVGMMHANEFQLGHNTMQTLSQQQLHPGFIRKFGDHVNN